MKCVEGDFTIRYMKKHERKAAKDKGRKVFNPNHGDHNAVFDYCSLCPEVHTYYVQEVVLMPHLRALYRARLCNARLQKIEMEAKTRMPLISQRL